MARHPLASVDFMPPEGWHDASILSFVAPENGAFRANILVTHETVADADVSAFADRQNAELHVALPKYERHSLDNVRVGDIEAVRVEYTFAAPDDARVRQRVVYALRDGVAYTLVMTCEDRGFVQMQPLFDSVLASYKLA